MPTVRTAYATDTYVRETFESTLSQTTFEIEHYYDYNVMVTTRVQDMRIGIIYRVIMSNFITRDNQHAILYWWPTLNSYTVMLPDGHKVAPRIPQSNIPHSSVRPSQSP